MQFDEQIYLKGFLKQMKFKKNLFQNEVFGRWRMMFDQEILKKLSSKLPKIGAYCSKK